MSFKSWKINCGSGLRGDSAPVLDVKASWPQKGREELPTLQREGRGPCAVRAFQRGALLTGMPAESINLLSSSNCQAKKKKKVFRINELIRMYSSC